MSDKPNILKNMDDESIRWQNCAICGKQKQRVVRQPKRPDFALCDNCGSAFVLEESGSMRMLYGHIPESMPETRAFALKKWRKYFEIRARAVQETPDENQPEILPAELKNDSEENATPGAYSDANEAISALEAKKSDILYSRAKKLESPPRILRETGELPNLDDLFKDMG